ncbi:MAG: hypothetical protein WBC13_15980 [Dokdonella sp.]
MNHDEAASPANDVLATDVGRVLGYHAIKRRRNTNCTRRGDRSGG